MVNINDYEYRNSVGVMGGKHMISITAVRKATGLEAGDPIRVRLTVADTPRKVEVPDDLVDALAANPTTTEFFAMLSNSVQRYHIDNINGAKTPETRQRRIEKAVALFREGKPRERAPTKSRGAAPVSTRPGRGGRSRIANVADRAIGDSFRRSGPLPEEWTDG